MAISRAPTFTMTLFTIMRSAISTTIPITIVGSCSKRSKFMIGTPHLSEDGRSDSLTDAHRGFQFTTGFGEGELQHETCPGASRLIGKQPVLAIKQTAEFYGWSPGKASGPDKFK